MGRGMNPRQAGDGQELWACGWYGAGEYHGVKDSHATWGFSGEKNGGSGNNLLLELNIKILFLAT